jgi:tetratricopeptide (TPR) repeat protein
LSLAATLCHPVAVESRDRILRAGAATLVVSHLVAAWLAPTALWGLSHLAGVPPLVAVAWTAAALGVVVAAPRLAARGAAFSYPDRIASALLALACVAPFWIARERTHLFGDGALLIRDRGLSDTITRAPLLVRAAHQWVLHTARFGLTSETALAILSIVAGVVAVFALLRLAASLTPDRGGRLLAAVLLLTAGSTQLFFGHVEYYAMLAAATALYLWLACALLGAGRPTWPTWLAWGALLPVHLSALAFLPAQAVLALRELRAGRRRAVLTTLAAAAGLGLAMILPRLVGRGMSAFVATTWAGPQRYLAPFFNRESTRHAFGFLSAQHWLALLNDLLLAAPLALVALPVLWRQRRGRPDAIHAFLAAAAVGALLFSILFHRELGPIRDWDILSANAFVLLAFVAARLVRPHPGHQRTAALIVAAAGLHHLVPWVALQTRPAATVAWIERHTRASGQLSPHARAYWYEEIAILHRQHGDEAASLLAYEAAVAANPSDARYHVGLGNRYLMRGEMERAAEQYEDALRRRPNLAPAHNNLAYTLALLGRDLDAALAHAQAALAADSTRVDYWTTLARVESTRGDPAAARAAAANALRRRPDAAEARAILAAIDAGLPVPSPRLETPAVPP